MAEGIRPACGSPLDPRWIWPIPRGMPSQRLLTMMDPLGHVTARRRAADGTPTAVVWAATTRTARWILAELSAAGVAAVRATAFRHVDASLRGEVQPPCAIAILDFRALSAANLASLMTARWMGYRGALIAVAAPGLVSAQTQAVVRIDAVVAPDSGEQLRHAVLRALPQNGSPTPPGPALSGSAGAR